MARRFVCIPAGRFGDAIQGRDPAFSLPAPAERCAYRMDEWDVRVQAWPSRAAMLAACEMSQRRAELGVSTWRPVVPERAN